MRILALETSGMAGSIAVLDGETVLGEIVLDPTRRTAQTLVPAIEAVLQQVTWEPTTVQLVAVTTGPGSFTGLRIGVTTAKTFVYATGAALVGVNTLSVLARGVFTDQTEWTGPLWVVLNAERDQLFAASFQRAGSEWTEVEPTRIMDNHSWLRGLKDGTLVGGSGLTGLVGQIPKGVHIAPESTWTACAGNVGREGLRAFQAGRVSDCWSLMPNYYRESAAVEKADGAQGVGRSNG